MQLFTVPQWLQNRRILKSDLQELQQLFLDRATPVVGNLSLEQLKKFYQEHPKVTFYKVVRLLGFYGVIFTDKLTSYSGPNEARPELVSISILNRQGLLADYTGKPILFLLGSCGIKTLEQLHGVPVQSLRKLLECISSFEDFLEKIPFTVVPTTSEFFIHEGPPVPVHQDENEQLRVISKVLGEPVEILNLSIRSYNCLWKKGVKNIGELVHLKPRELLEIKNFGRKSLREITDKLSQYSLKLGIDERITSDLVSINERFGIDLDNKETFVNLTTSLRDLVLSVRIRKALNTYNIEYVWQVVSSTENQLLKMKNFGRKSLGELKKKLSKLDLHLGIVFSPEQIMKIQSFEKYISKQEVDEVFLNRLNDHFAQTLTELQKNPLPFLGERENQIAHERLWPTIKKRTLEDIASELGVSRERIRQIEKKTRSKIKQQYRKELRDIVSIVRTAVSALGSLSSISHLPIQLYTVNNHEQNIVTELISLIDEKLFLDWRFDLISEKGESWVDQVCSSVRKTIHFLYADKFFTHSVLNEAIVQVIAQYNLNKEIIQRPLTKKVKFTEKISSSGNLLCFGRITKQDKMVLNFKDHFPKGLDIHKQAEQLLKTLRKEEPETFRNASPRSVIARLVDHPDIFLWGRGFYIHRDNITFNMSIVREAADWIIQRFERGHSKFQVDLPYIKFGEEMGEEGVPNEYALYTLLRTLNNQRIGQRKFPALVDRLSAVDINETVREELENYLLDAKGPVPYTQIRQEFIEKRGWKQYSLQQHLSTHIENIYPWKDHTYIHVEYLSVDYVKLDELISEIRKKLASIQGVYSLKGAIHEFQVLWHQVCPDATIQTMIKLIRSVEPPDLEINQYMISFQKKTGSESISLAAEMEDYFLEKHIELSTFELKSEFQKTRGWSDNQYYGALRKANLFQSGKNSFVHPTTINWNPEISAQVHAILNDKLEVQNSRGIPHILLSEIIDEYILPELPNDIEWTVELLKNVSNELGDSLFFSDACILVENQFNIEDLDDMIAFLINKSFKYNLAKQIEVEKLLWRHGILASGRPIPKNEVFFPESSIKYLPDSNEIKLSQIGIERYAT